MLKSMYRMIVAAVVLATVAACSRTAQTDSEGANTRIAINVPLTGPIAGWSGQFVNGFTMGIEDASAEFDLDPAGFVVLADDNAGDAGQASAIFSRQKMSGFDVYISVATGPANAVMGDVDAMEVPHFIAAFDPFITKGGKNRLRIMANSKAEAPLIVEYAKERNAKTVAIVQLNFAYANEQVGELIVPALEAEGMSTTRELFDIERRDFDVIAEKLLAQKPDLIFLVGYSFHLQALVRDLKERNLVGDGNVVATMDLVDLIDPDTPSPELGGMVFDAPLIELNQTAEAASWEQRFEDRFHAEATYVPAFAYDTAWLIVKARSELPRGQKLTTDALVHATPFEGLNGMIELDGDRDIRVTGALARYDAERGIVPLN